MLNPNVKPNCILYEIYNQADIFIMLSQNDIKFDVEGFGIAILEANLLGIPAIGSRDTGIEDAIVHNETGKLVDPYSVEEIFILLVCLTRVCRHQC